MQRGNPYHDERGRFTTPWGAIKLSDSAISDYALEEAEAWQEDHSEVEPDGYEYGQPYLREASYDQAMEDELNNRAYEVEGEIRELNKEYNKRICERIKTANYEQLKSYVEHPEEYDRDIREQLEGEYDLYHADMMLDSMAEDFPGEIADLRYRRIVAKCNGNRKLFAMAAEEKDGYGLNGYASDYATQAIKARGLEEKYESWKQHTILTKAGPIGIKNPNATQFHKKFLEARETQSTKKRWRVATDYSAEDYREHERFVAEDGSTFAIHNGDIVSVCTVDGSPVRGHQLLEKAVANGGVKLDAYSGIFTFYTKCGFEPVSVCKWDDDYAPEDWVKANGFTDDSWKGKSDRKWSCKREDIVFFKYTGKKQDLSFNEWIKTAEYSADYDAAMNKRDEEISNGKK